VGGSARAAPDVLGGVGEGAATEGQNLVSATLGRDDPSEVLRSFSESLNETAEEIRAAVEAIEQIKSNHDRLVYMASAAGKPEVGGGITSFLQNWWDGLADLESDAESLAANLADFGALYLQLEAILPVAEPPR